MSLKEIRPTEPMLEYSGRFEDIKVVGRNSSFVRQIEAGTFTDYRMIGPPPKPDQVRAFIFRIVCLAKGQMNIVIHKTADGEQSVIKEEDTNIQPRRHESDRIINVDCM